MRDEACGVRGDEKTFVRDESSPNAFLRAAGFTPAVFEPSVLRARKTVGVKPTARVKTFGTCELASGKYRRHSVPFSGLLFLFRV
jgi:hypothetical protein